MKHIFWVIILGFLCIGCDNFTAKKFSESIPSIVLCKASQTKSVAEFEPLFFTNTKIHNEDFSSNSIGIQKVSGKFLKASEPVTLVLDRNCYLQNGLQTDLFEIQNEHLNIKTPYYSETESVRAILLEEIEISDLKTIIEGEPCIVGLSPNIKLHTTEPNDSLYRNQRHLSAIDHPATYDFFFHPTSGIRNNIVIAIIDNGTDIDHPDLSPVIWRNAVEAAGRAGVDDDQNGYVDDINGWDFASNNNNPRNKFNDDHGTHVAGLAGASGNNQIGVSGVMSRNVRIMPLNVFGEIDGADIDNIDQAIRYAADNGAKVINLSLGGMGRISSTGSALQYAISRGVTIFAAAGNENIELSSTQFFTPASFAKDLNGMISIGASNASNKNAKCSFSNYSSAYVELAAPGCDSASPNGLLSTLSAGRYGYMYGTSMASPIAAGSGAVALQMMRDFSNTEMAPAELEEMLLQAATTQTFPSNFIENNRHLSLTGISNFIRSTVQGCP